VKGFGGRITWLGHAAFLIESPGGARIAVDPWIGNNPKFPKGFAFGRLDVVAATHGHFDHFGDDGIALARDSGATIVGIFELALHCDLRVAGAGARMGMPLARIGLVVPFPLGQKLVEVIGPAHTRHLLFTGQPIDAKRALEIGMVHQVVGSAELEGATSQLAQSIARNAPLALAGIKATIQRAISLRDSITHADLDEASARARQSADASEGRRAMLEKRRPNFRGA